MASTPAMKLRKQVGALTGPSPPGQPAAAKSTRRTRISASRQLLEFPVAPDLGYMLPGRCCDTLRLQRAAHAPALRT